RPGFKPIFPPGSLLGGSAPDVPLANNTATQRFDLAAQTWSTGPTWTMQRADFGLASTGTKLVAMGGDTTGGGYFDSSTEVDELDLSTWPAGTWAVSAPALPAMRQANQAGFYANGLVYSVAGLFGPTCCSWLSDVQYRTQPSAVPCGTNTPT